MTSATHPGAHSERLVVESSYSELEVVVDAAYSFFSAYTDNMDLLHKVMLLTSEAVTNGMKHGNKLAAGKTVTVDFKCNTPYLEVWGEDEGEGFIREDIPDPLSAEHLMDEGGRGVFLIEKMADEVRYELGGRRIGMIFLKESEESG